MTNHQPPITPGSGLLSSDWLPGPLDGTEAAVVVSYTDFWADSEEDLQQVFEVGLKLGESWPVMHGAVGMWLWGKPTELRGGSLSVWERREDLRRFVRWPVHTAIIREWRDRIKVRSESWDDGRFDPHQAWSRAERHMRMTENRPPAVLHSKNKPPARR